MRTVEVLRAALRALLDDARSGFVFAIPTNALFGKVRISPIIWLRFVNSRGLEAEVGWVRFCIPDAAVSRGCGEAASRTLGEDRWRHSMSPSW